MHNQFLLMKDRRFLPLFVTQFLGALNDNLFKTSVSVMLAYGFWTIEGWDPAVVVSLAAGLFIVPFVLFAPLAGDLADKYDKAIIVRWVKIAEIGIVMGAIAAITIHSALLALVVLFAFGAQSAFFSPSKFALLPQHLQAEELIGGNGLLNTGTYLAILAGTILGGLLGIGHDGMLVVAGLLVVAALAGYAACRYIPSAPPPVPHLKLNYNVLFEAVKIIFYAYKQPRGVFTAILGISWFYFFGATMLAQFPNFTQHVLGADNVVLTFFMAVFSVGIACGGLLNNRLLRSKVEATFVPWAALGMTVCAVDLFIASHPYAGVHDVLLGLGDFLSAFSGWRIVFDLFGLSVAGGLYVVPLKSIVQYRTPKDHRARVLAGSALIDSLFILASSLISAGFLEAGFEVGHLFLMVGIATAGVALFMCRLLPKGKA